jgi:hypothetical protein
MQTKYGNIDKLYPIVTALSHNLVTNEIHGTVAYFLTEADATSGQFEPVHRKNVSWLIDGDNNALARHAIELGNA